MYNTPIKSSAEAGFRYLYQHLFVEPCWSGPNKDILCKRCDKYERKLAESKMRREKKLNAIRIALINPRRSQRLKIKKKV